MQNPKFTFCIPNLNKIEYLPACIESVLAQDCDDWCCVFVDGYSTDGSWEYMQQYVSDPRFLIRRGIKQGMYADWNECLKEVNSEYFYILTSDDTCFPSLVSTTIDALDQVPDIDACHFQYALIDEVGNLKQSYEEITQEDFEIYTGVNHFPHRRNGLTEFMMHLACRAIYRTITSLVFRRRLLDILKGFETIYGTAGDQDWTMRMTLQTDILYIPELLATWRRYDDQATALLAKKNYFRNSLQLVQDNIVELIQKEADLNLKRPLNRNHLTSEYLDNHASYFYNQAIRTKDISTFAKNLVCLTKMYPFYVPKKIVNRLSGNRFFVYPSRLSRSLDFIDTYGLQWPPEPIELHFKSSSSEDSPVYHQLTRGDESV